MPSVPSVPVYLSALIPLYFIHNYFRSEKPHKIPIKTAIILTKKESKKYLFSRSRFISILCQIYPIIIPNRYNKISQFFIVYLLSITIISYFYNKSMSSCMKGDLTNQLLYFILNIYIFNIKYNF